MPAKYTPAYIFSEEEFNDLRKKINQLGKDVEQAFEIFEKLYKCGDEEDTKFTLNIFELEELTDFYQCVCNIQYKLQEYVWLDDDEEDEKRYFPKRSM